MYDLKLNKLDSFKNPSKYRDRHINVVNLLRP